MPRHSGSRLCGAALHAAPRPGQESAYTPATEVHSSASLFCNACRRVNVVGLRLPEEDEAPAPLTRRQALQKRLAELWTSVAGV